MDIVLITNDQKEFTISDEIATQSRTIITVLEDSEDSYIPLADINSATFKKVLEYCKYQINYKKQKLEDDSQNWNDTFFSKMDKNEVFELIHAANYLDISELLMLSCKKIASFINGKNVEEIREIFDIENDFSPEEEAQARKDNSWAN